MPEGFRYVGDLLSVEEEEGLARELEALPFKPFDFHGYEANRQVVGFGFRYDYSRREVVEAPPVPTFLDPVRQRIGEAFDRPPEDFEQVLINEYRPGAGIGWHRDKPQFGEVVGVSLLAPCNFRLRLRSGEAWDRFSLWSRAPLTCWRVPRGPAGSTAFRHWIAIATPSLFVRS
ncbi:MAG: alpha-ketoglutarate-dependent dioxygenase AlkB, partial [Roseiarcus sp.]